jgi:hypothetical protein
MVDRVDDDDRFGGWVGPLLGVIIALVAAAVVKPKSRPDSLEQPVGPPAEPSEYDLKVDQQVEKYLETKQKLTYFLVTASVAVVALLLKFVSETVRPVAAIGWVIWVVIAAAVTGLLAAGASLLNLNLELRSYNLHLMYRTLRVTWDDLSSHQRQTWDLINARAARCRQVALFLVFGEIALAVWVFALLFLYFPHLIGTPTK